MHSFVYGECGCAGDEKRRRRECQLFLHSESMLNFTIRMTIMNTKQPT